MDLWISGIGYLECMSYIYIRLTDVFVILGIVITRSCDRDPPSLSAMSSTESGISVLSITRQSVP